MCFHVREDQRRHVSKNQLFQNEKNHLPSLDLKKFKSFVMFRRMRDMKNKQTNKQTNKQASKQTNKQTSKQANNQSINQSIHQCTQIINPKSTNLPSNLQKVFVAPSWLGFLKHRIPQGSINTISKGDEIHLSTTDFRGTC